MKLLTLLVAGIATADEKKVPPRHPLQRLNRLVEFSAEILKSDSFNTKSEKWVKMWTEKFSNNAGRMETNFNRGNQRCGYYDEK